MSNEKTSMGFISWLLLMFIGLKLTNYIDWAWWWVLSPAWLPMAGLVFLWLILCAVILIGEFFNRLLNRK